MARSGAIIGLMGDNRILRVLDAARIVEDDVNRLIKKHRLPNSTQLRGAVEGISASIQEGLGRDQGPDRARFLGYAKGSAEEGNSRLRTRFAANDLPARDYWRNHHRLVTIVKMLDALIDSQ